MGDGGHMRKRLIGIMLAVTMLVGSVSGCGKSADASGNGALEADGAPGTENAEGSAGRGRFMESEVALPEGVERILAMEQLADGSVKLFGSDANQMQFVTAQTIDLGEHWEVQRVAGGELSEEGYIESCAIDKEGTLAVLVSAQNEADEIENRVGYVQADGTLRWQELSSDEAVYMWECRFDASGNLLCQGAGGNVYKVDPATGECGLYCDTKGAYSVFFEMADNLVIVMTNPNGILLYDAADDGRQTDDAALNELLTSGSMLSGSTNEYKKIVFHGGTQEGQIIYVCHDGIYCYTQGGSVSEQLVNGSLTTLGDTTVSFVCALMPDEDHFLAAIRDGNGQYKLLKYSYDKDALSMPEKELKVYALMDSAYLRQVVSAYQHTYQDVYINLQIGMSGEDGVTAEDALRALNTDILAGNGPDVLILDGMPVDSYIEKEMLADLTPLVEELRAQDGLFENVVAAYERDGKIYEIPARFYLPVIVGEPEAVEAGATLSGLCDYTKLRKESGSTKILGGASAENLLETLYAADAAKLVKNDGTVNGEELAAWLASAKQMYDLEKHTEDMGMSYYGDAGGLSLYGTQNAFGILLGECELSIGTLTSMPTLTTLLTVVHEAGVSYDVVNRDSVRSFMPYQKAGIVNGTSQMEEAQNFVRTMLGLECEQSINNGFPVNRAAYDCICEEVKKAYGDDAGVAVSTDEGVSLEFLLKNPTDEELAAFTAMLESLNMPSDTDEVIEGLIMEQAKNCLLGEKSVEDACAEIEKKINLYLAE